MNEIVKYDNYMNSLKFTGFTTTDFNFLMLLCSKAHDEDIKKIIIPFDELRQKAAYTRTSIQQFRTDLERMNEKLMRVTCKLKTETKTIMFVLFPTFEIDVEQQTLTVAVNEHFRFILNELVKNFTRFDLNEFVKLDSKYSKTLYRLLKQFKITGRFEIRLDDFRKRMDCPAYSTKYMMDKIIKPSLEELQPYFTDLQCTVQYAHKRGRPVEGYIFTFKPEKPAQTEEIPVEADKPAKSRSKKGISQEERDKLVEEFGEEITEDYIERTKQYKCCSYDTIREWIMEDKAKQKKKNKFANFPQRNYKPEEMKEMEQALLKHML